MGKKYQVFISSTFDDLKDERMEAILSILDSGNIPACMELFKSGNNSQWDTIKKWINESDIFMLILGGRYGTVENGNKKSYTHLEYEYAISVGKPVFSLILTESYLHQKASKEGEENIFERQHEKQYKKFKNQVTKKVIRKVDDIKDIRHNIGSSINEISSEYHLDGWVRNSVHGSIRDEFAELGINKCFYPSTSIPYSEIGIEGAKTIDIIRTSGPAFFRELRIPFMAALQNGALMRVILATSNSEYIKEVEIMQRTNPDYQYVNNIDEELIQAEINLGNISNGNIFLGHFQTQFRANILILDQKKAFYTPVLPPKLSEDTITFRLDSGPLLKDCIMHFNTVYNMLIAQNKIRKIESSH